MNDIQKIEENNGNNALNNFGTQIGVQNIFYDGSSQDKEVETITVEYSVFAPSPFDDTYYEFYFEHKLGCMHYTIENSPYLLNEIYNIKAEAMMIDKSNKIFKIKLDFIYKHESSYNGIPDDYKQYEKEEKLQIAIELNNQKIKIKAIELFLNLIYKSYNFAHTTDEFYLAVIYTILNFAEYDHDHVDVYIQHKGTYIFKMKTNGLFIPTRVFAIKNIEQLYFNNFYYEYIAYLLINYISNPKLDISNLIASETINNLFFVEERLDASWVHVKPDN